MALRLRRFMMAGSGGAGGESIMRRSARGGDAPTTTLPVSKKARLAVHQGQHGPVRRIAFWNVNGLRAVAKKPNAIPGLLAAYRPDLLCLSETKCRREDNPLELSSDGYRCYMNSATVKKGGYSGTAIYTKVEPESVSYGIGECDDEGRLMTMELHDYYLVVVYVPNSGSGGDRLKYRTTEWDVKFRQYVRDLQHSKPVIIAGDLNVAHLDIDVHDPVRNRNKTAGFYDEERDNFALLLQECDLVDMYRKLHPFETTKAYTYYSYRFNCRAKQKGWRLDYVLASSRIAERIHDVRVVHDQIGSDHLPIVVDLLTEHEPEPVDNESKP